MKVSLIFAAILLAAFVCCSEASITLSPTPASTIVAVNVASSSTAVAGGVVASMTAQASLATVSPPVVDSSATKVVTPSSTVMTESPCSVAHVVSPDDCEKACCTQGSGIVPNAYCPHCNSTMWTDKIKKLFEVEFLKTKWDEVTDKTGRCTNDTDLANKISAVGTSCERDCPKEIYEARCGAMELVSGLVTLISLLVAILMTA